MKTYKIIIKVWLTRFGLQWLMTSHVAMVWDLKRVSKNWSAGLTWSIGLFFFLNIWVPDYMTSIMVTFRIWSSGHPQPLQKFSDPSYLIVTVHSPPWLNPDNSKLCDNTRIWAQKDLQAIRCHMNWMLSSPVDLTIFFPSAMLSWGHPNISWIHLPMLGAVLMIQFVTLSRVQIFLMFILSRMKEYEALKAGRRITGKKD